MCVHNKVEEFGLFLIDRIWKGGKGQKKCEEKASENA
jgi:hypothetical protein